MIKTYILTRPYHNYSFILSNKSGFRLRYDFTGGNSLTNVKARLVLKGQYAQELLEASNEFKSGLVKIDRVEDGGEETVVGEDKKEPTIIESVTSPEQLIEFVGTELGKTYQRPDAALAFANKNGYEFPNLDITSKKEE